VEDLREAIETGVLFGRGGIWPVWFRWNGRKVQVRQVTMRWRTTQGRALITHFAVTDGLNLYELTLNHQDLTWHLTGAGE